LAVKDGYGELRLKEKVILIEGMKNENPEELRETE